MRLRSLPTLVIGAFALLAIPVSATAEIDMVEGEWETTIVAAGGTNTITPSTWQECLTHTAPIPMLDPIHFKECRIKKHSIFDNTVSWHVVCFKDDKKIKGKGKITFHGESYIGTMTLRHPDDSSNTSTKIAFSGRRLIPCREGKSSRQAQSGENPRKMLLGKKTPLQKARAFWDSTKKHSPQ